MKLISLEFTLTRQPLLLNTTQRRRNPRQKKDIKSNLSWRNLLNIKFELKQKDIMIIYTNPGNPFGLEMLLLAKLAKQPVEVKQINLNGELVSKLHQFLVDFLINCDSLVSFQTLQSRESNSFLFWS